MIGVNATATSVISEKQTSPNAHSKLDDKKDKNINNELVQPTLSAPVPQCQRNMTLPLMSDSSELLDVSEEELKDLLSQKDLATTLAENLLKHFGSEEMDVKEETSGKHTRNYLNFYLTQKL